jgi:hypothetical protein
MPRFKTKGSFKKGDGRSRKPKGAVNRTTKEAKEFLEQVMFGQLENMNAALNTLYGKDQARYLDACSKLFTYVLPKQTDVTSDGKAIIPQMPTVIINTKRSGG